MTQCLLSQAMSRIRAATPERKVAVFTCKSSHLGFVDIVISNTIRTQSLIRGKDARFIGEYHREMHLLNVRNEIKARLNDFKKLKL